LLEFGDIKEYLFIIYLCQLCADLYGLTVQVSWIKAFVLICMALPYR